MPDWNPRSPYNALPPLQEPARYRSEATRRAGLEALDLLADLERNAATPEARDALEQAATFQEAWATCWIEGVETNLLDLVRSQHRLGGNDYPIRQGIGAMRAWENAHAEIEPEAHFPNGTADDGHDHGVTTTHVETWCTSMKQQPMHVRSIRVFIGNPYECRYMPPEGTERLRTMLDELWRFTRAPYDDPIARMAMAHYQFEAIHPFADGNGRTGRLLNAALLYQSGVPGSTLVAPSVEILHRRHEYYDLLTEMTRSNCWERWILFVATVLAEAARRTRGTWSEHTTYAEERIRKWLVRTPKPGQNAVLRQGCLRMSTTASEIAGRHGAPDANATRRMLDRMTRWGLLRRERGRGRRPYINEPAVATWQVNPERASRRPPTT